MAVPNGEYNLIVKYLGYEDFIQKILITEDKQMVMNFSLKLSNIEVKGADIIGNVEKQDKITNAPATKETISSEKIEIQSSTNLGSYLKGLKGVDYTASGMDSYSISVRGFNSSFSSRLLTLTDGRVANIPALRVVSYNTIPQSQDDIEKMEVILGPATALYGANAHSGVVNIVSKPPATSEGFRINVSGSNDNRELRKINGRYAKKINDHISFKVSASYLSAYEWEFISEDEWKNHKFAWIGSPDRTVDKKDNNPWNSSFTLSDDQIASWETIENIIEESGWNIQDYWNDLNGDGIYQENEYIGPQEQISYWDTVVKYVVIDGELILIGNGEANHGDLDGDGVAGEDWANGVDDDGDGLIDEDYFEADGIDNDGDGLIDENIDDQYDLSYDGADNNGNGQIDETWEYDHDGDGTSNWGSALDSDLKIIIYDGRKEQELNGTQNEWYYVEDELGNLQETTDTHIRGDYIWDEDKFTILFDVFDKDYGNDGIAGDYFEDKAGNGQYELGEPNFLDGFLDYGLDGINYTFDEGEGDGQWQPGDSWVDTNNNGIVDDADEYDINQNLDVWPLPNGQWDPGENYQDWGQDGIHGTGDIGEGNGAVPIDQNELDGNYDTGDGCFGCNSNELSLIDRFQNTLDNNGDGFNDYPDFRIDNRKIEARIDIEGLPFWDLDELDLTFQSGYSWSKTQVTTGVGRYLMDGWEYTFNQFRANYKNWFFQTYVNRSFSGNTRGYLRGDRIIDLSKNRAYQIQNNFNIKPFDTEIIWGIDYFKTEPVTNGTILNDGPNGRDEDGDGVNDNPEEFDNALANELGIYFQTSSKLSKMKKLGKVIDWSDKWELITAARLDYHDQLQEEGLQFGPKIGLMYNPNPKHSFRLTFGRAFNTPTTTSLFTNYYVQDFSIFNVYLRGNKDGTQYVRVDENTNVSQPIYYDAQGNAIVYGNYDFDVDTNLDGLINEQDTDYLDRIQDMPYFYLYDVYEGVPSDWIPLDTSNFLVYIPEPNGDGHIIRPSDVKEGERYIPDVPAIKSEKINSFELGYKTMIKSAVISIDYYVNHYSDFFSPATYITPTVIYRFPNGDVNGDGILNEFDEATLDDIDFAGFIPANQNNSNPPYGTGWNGIDDDGDWIVWASEFGWDQDDLNGDGDPRDPGEWGFVDLETGNVYTPAQLGFDGQGLPWIYNDPNNNQFGINYNLLDKVGIDEWSPQEGLGEYECDSYPCSSESVQGRATSPPEIILGVLNYGNVWTQGMDVAFTQILSPKLFLNGNFSWYNTTEFYNELTRREDPINAPKFKWNFNLTWKNRTESISAGYRHVDKFEWQDGIWAGEIGPYDLFDLHYKHEFNKNLDLSISCLNIFNDMHRELIGGAKMGRQIILRVTTKF